MTGAASGIGRATAARLTEHGWTVAGLDRAPVDAVALGLQVDVTDRTPSALPSRRWRARSGRSVRCVSVAGHYEMTPDRARSPASSGTGCCACTLGGLANLVRGRRCPHARAPDADVDRRGRQRARRRRRRSRVTRTTQRPRARYSGWCAAWRPRSRRAACGSTRSRPARPTPRCSPRTRPWRAPDYLETLPLRRTRHPGRGRPVRRLPGRGRARSASARCSTPTPER